MNRKLIHTVFEQHASLHPGRVAIEEERLNLTYEDLNSLSNQLAHHLLQLLKETEQPIVVFGNRGYELIASVLGVFKAGHLYVPLDINHPAKSLGKALDIVCPGVAIVPATHLEKVVQLLCEEKNDIKYLLVVEGADQVGVYDTKGCKLQMEFISEVLNPSLNIDVEAPNYIYFTSGTTGTPKAILGIHQSLGHFINWETTVFELNKECRVAQLIQFTFDASLRDIFVPLSLGGTLCIPSVSTFSNFALLMRWVRENKISLMHSVPSLFRVMIKELKNHLKQSELDFDDLEYILLSGEPLYARDVRSWRDLTNSSAKIVNLYGPTETTMVKTYHEVGDLKGIENYMLHVGKPITNTKIVVLNNGNPCGVGEIGEVYIKTPFVTKGYFKNKELTSHVFVQNPLVNNKVDIIYKTGDLGRVDKDLNLEVLGRIDEQVKVGGVRIEIKEVKTTVLSHEQVDDAIVLVHQNDEHTNLLTCYYTSQKLKEENLKVYLESLLDSGKMPSYIVRLEEFPLTYNGKVNKNALPHPSILGEREKEIDMPRGDKEQALATIWAEVLGIEPDRLGRNVQFFNIGGSSLRAIQVVARVYKTFGVRLIIGDVFTNNTIAKLAAHINQSTKVDNQGIAAIPVADYYPISHAQNRLLIMDQYERHQYAYNINASYSLQGNLDKQAITKAFDQLVKRHDSLRTVFRRLDGIQYQKVIDPWDFNVDIQIVDLSDTVDKEAQTDVMLDSAFHHVFDLFADTLFLVRLVKQEQDKHIFILTIHHIIADGWSMNVFVDDLISFYNANLNKEESPLADLEIQYKDYSHWHNEQLKGESLRKHQDYWRSVFNDYETLDSLFDDEIMARLSGDFSGNRHSFMLEEELSDQLKKAAVKHNATLFQILLAATHAMLYAHYGVKDLVIGSPIAGRVHKEFENQIGFYVNMLPFRNKIVSEQSLSALISSVSETSKQVYEHEIYPFDMLVEDLDLPKKQHGAPLFDVVVQLQDTETKQSSTEDAKNLNLVEIPSRFLAAKYALTMDFYAGQKGLAVEMEYHTGLFDKTDTLHLSESFIQIANNIANNPTISLKDIRNKVQSKELPAIDAAKSLINVPLDDSF